MKRAFFLLSVGFLSASLLTPRLRAQDDGDENGAPPPPPQQMEGARPEGGGPPAPPPMDADKLKKRFGLSDEQAAKFKDALKAHEGALKPLRELMRDGMKKLAGQLKDKADDKEVASALESLEGTHKAIEEENHKFNAATAAFLTPTQRAKMLLGMMARMRQGGRRGPGGRKGPGQGGGQGAGQGGGGGDSGQ
jgi:Spy/CpxP family protein refolding chaperone